MLCLGLASGKRHTSSPTRHTKARQELLQLDAAVLEIYKGETRTASGSIKTPAITFTPNAHSQEVVIHAATMYHGRGEGNVPLREITADFVQAQVLKFFERLVGEG